MNLQARGRRRCQDWYGSARTIHASQYKSFGSCSLLVARDYHIRTHDKYSFAENTLVITYTLIAGGGGEVLGVETGGGGDLRRTLKVVTTKCNIAITGS